MSSTDRPQSVLRKQFSTLRRATTEPYLYLAVVVLLTAAGVIIVLPWGIDLGIHAATLQRWLHDPTPDVHPLIDVAGQSPYYSPYMGWWTLVGYATGLPVLNLLRLAGAVNCIIFVSGVFYFVRACTPSRWAPVWALTAMGLVWGWIVTQWSGFFSLASTTFSTPFPSFFCTAVGLWIWGMVIRSLRDDRLRIGYGIGIVLTCTVILLSHQFSTLGIGLGVICMVVPTLIRRPRRAGRWCLAAVAVAVLALAWPYYHVWRVLGGSDAYDAFHVKLYEDFLGRYGLLLLALPAVVQRVRHRGITNPLVLPMIVMAAVVALGGLTGHYSWIRILPFAAILLQTSLGIELCRPRRTAAVSADDPPVGRNRFDRVLRWVVTSCAAVALVMGAWSQLAVVPAFFPSTEAAMTKVLPGEPLKFYGRYDWATRHMKYGDVILTDDHYALRMAPGYGPFTVESPYPEPLLLAQAAKREADTDTFLDEDTSASKRQAILDRYHVRWVIEKTSSWTPPDTTWGRQRFTKVAEQDDVVLYRVNR